MPVEIICSSCNARLRLDERQLGKKIRCSKCKAVFLTSARVEEPLDAEIVEDEPLPAKVVDDVLSAEVVEEPLSAQIVDEPKRRRSERRRPERRLPRCPGCNQELAGHTAACCYLPSKLDDKVKQGEKVLGSFCLTQCKKGWFLYDILHGVDYHCHLLETRLILEARVMSGAGFFLLKALTTAVSLGFGANLDATSHTLSDAKAAAIKVRGQFISIPYEEIARLEPVFFGLVRIVLRNPGRAFDPNSLVFSPRGMQGWRMPIRVRRELIQVANEMIRRS
jgi:hypothetical protein